MCGFYVTNAVLSANEFRHRLERIKFRGPDYTGILEKDHLHFGHLRLSIMDLSEKAHQPMVFENLTIVFNGEIYNFPALREELKELGYTFETTGDTEVILKGYNEWKAKIVDKLNGMFAFVIYDAETKEIFCSRDRLGVKPLYYYWKDGVLEICSQLRPMHENKKISHAAISIYLDCTYIPSPYSIYEDVYKLQPGHNLKINLNTGNIELFQYWDLSKVKKSKLKFAEAKEHLHALLRDAVKIRMNADVTWGSFLSGGIDSALVSSIAAKLSPTQINTYTVGFDSEKYDESQIAAQYASVIQSVHTETICGAKDFLELLPLLIQVYDEPFGDSSALPSLLLNKIARQAQVTVSLSGDGGDESFLGYNHFDMISRYRFLFKIPCSLRLLLSKLLILPFRKRESVKRLLHTKTIKNFIENIFAGTNTLQLKRERQWLENYSTYWTYSGDIKQKVADINIKLWLENDSNVKVDRASMASSLEVRSPFLDYRIVEFARSLPVKYRIFQKQKKYILREILKEYIPEEIFDQPKKGFACPIEDWIRNELKSEFVQNLSDEFLNKIPNLNVSKFKRMLEEHLSGKYEYSSYIWRVYVLIKWYLEFNHIQPE
jgi:asparagine synthase (glutamine-hydrolysing)